MTASLRGFPELLPEERIVEQAVTDHLRSTFELHGFAAVETRAVEPLEVLLRKGEIDKEVYSVRRLGDPTDGDDRIALHYDLTVPFARYVLERADKLQFPFRRYQIQKVWRGEKPQAGRYREFTQADIDVVGREHLPFEYDVEVASVMAAALSGLHYLPAMRLQVNNRKLIEGFYLGIGARDVTRVMPIVDKLERDGTEVTEKRLRDDAGLEAEQISKVLALAEIYATDASFVEAVLRLGIAHPLLSEGLDELQTVIDRCSAFATSSFWVEADLSIARGLDYYTGTIFETRMAGHETLGSVCSGGRYESLASDAKRRFPGTGISLGVTRMLVPLLQSGYLRASRKVPTAVLVILPSEDDRAFCDQIAYSLRARGVPAEVSTSPDRYGEQLGYAARRGIPYAWFPAVREGSRNEVRDLERREQFEVADNWTPPDSDVQPSVIGHGVDE